MWLFPRPSSVRIVSIFRNTTRTATKNKTTQENGSPSSPPTAPSTDANANVRKPASLCRRSRSIPMNKPMARAKPSRASVGRYGHDGSCVITLASIHQPARLYTGANSIQMMWLRQRQTSFSLSNFAAREIWLAIGRESRRGKESPQDKAQVERVYGVTATVPILC